MIPFRNSKVRGSTQSRSIWRRSIYVRSKDGRTSEDAVELANVFACSSKVREYGGMMANVTLMLHELEWTVRDLYCRIRDRLVDSGSLVRGKGKGGSVQLAQDDETEHTAESGREVPREADLYDPLKRVLEDAWVREQRLGKQTLVEVTASQGSKNTGGKWSRPDIVVASLTTFPFLPQRHFDIVTFEVKTAAVDLTAVYEALAHYRAATRSYVLAHIPHPIDQDLTRIEEEAQRHGIGFIVVEDPGNHSTWDTRFEATYREPSPHDLDAFIASQFSEWAKDEIRTWFR